MWWMTLVGCTWITETELEARLSGTGCPEGTGPEYVEVWYDGVDQNCDGADDFDQDGDGHAALGSPEGALPSDDCWDDPALTPGAYQADDPANQLDAAAVYPGAVDTWYDGVDADCAGDDDYDQDGDGYASAFHARGDDLGADCFDALEDPFDNDGGLDPADVHPDATDAWYDGTDADCADNDDYDQDGDGFARDDECDDLDAARFPDAGILETWYDGIDANCDGNDGDQDGDGFYVEGYAYEVPAAYGAGDCWDAPADAPAWSPLNGFSGFEAAEAFPGAADPPYDGLDQDCAGNDDFDADGDSYRTDVYADAAGLVGDDCDDALATVYPGARETWYDDLDADCAGDDDFDQDADGYTTTTDCDDLDGDINPGALEACGNTIDEDCDANNNDDGALGCTDFYADVDVDGYGADTSACLCEAEVPYTAAAGGDCDDADATVNPAGTESCATADDDDCDGSTNAVDAAGCTDWYVDADGDTYGTTASQCACDATAGYPADNDDDCNDASASIHPARAESCNDLDDDCDSSVDEGLTLYYADADGDSYGAGVGDCASGTGLVSNDDDCDDTSDLVSPGGTEICDGVANDCTTAASWTSADEDGMVSHVNTAGVWSDYSASFGATAINYSMDSGTYYFCAGTYYAKLVGSGDTTDVVGLYGADVTTLENNAATGAVISVTNGSVTLSGLTITGGTGSGSSGSTYGGGILASVSSAVPTAPSLVLEDCVVTGNTAAYGGGVAAYLYAWIELVGTTVEDNAATGNGGGLYAYSNAQLTLQDSVVQNNTASSGGGIYTYAGSDLTLDGTTVEANTASTDGGGIYLDDGTFEITDSYVVDNYADDDGGGFFVDNGTVTCTGGGIYGNVAADHGGGGFLSNHLSTTARFTAVSCDFGTGATDNSPNDVELKTSGSTYAAYSAYSATASFVCTNATDLCI
ncbi:MAG: right-handed parallel beta-helix repeat-containing protein [Pseudomonadota bacterium]|nr:right-handed parallel beta-helix repeat-containing protein [Pseudomonadota bacterium]